MPLSPINRKIKGIGGSLGNIQRGTLRWTIEDDLGRKHDLQIPNSLYVPDSPSRLLSPQHWAQEARDVKPHPRGTWWCATYGDKLVLQWDQRKFTRTIAIDGSTSNIATLYTAPSYKHFEAYCARVPNDNTIIALDAHAISDDEDGETSREQRRERRALTPRSCARFEKREPPENDHPDKGWVDSRPSPTSFEFDNHAPTTAVIEMDAVEEPNRNVRNDVVTEFAHIHQRLGHLPPTKIQAMATAGILPRRLAKCQVPACRSRSESVV